MVRRPVILLGGDATPGGLLTFKPPLSCGLRFKIAFFLDFHVFLFIINYFIFEGEHDT